MSMSKKDFVSIASNIATIKGHKGKHIAINALMPSLYASNPRFDRARFLKACKCEDLI